MQSYWAPTRKQCVPWRFLSYRRFLRISVRQERNQKVALVGNMFPQAWTTSSWKTLGAPCQPKASSTTFADGVRRGDSPRTQKHPVEWRHPPHLQRKAGASPAKNLNWILQIFTGSRTCRVEAKKGTRGLTLLCSDWFQPGVDIFLFLWCPSLVSLLAWFQCETTQAFQICGLLGR